MISAHLGLILATLPFVAAFFYVVISSTTAWLLAINGYSVSQEKIKGIRFYPEANISSSLNENMSELELNGAKIVILGDEACYLGKVTSLFKGFLFALKIGAWVKRGATVEYILLRYESVNPVSKWHLTRLSKRLGSSFSVRKINQAQTNSDESFRALLAEYSTKHPTIITLGDGSNAFWIEYDHQPRSTVANGAKFAFPDAFCAPEVSREFNKYCETISAFRLNSTEVAI